MDVYSNDIEYRPYRIDSYGAFITVTAAILCFIVAGAFLPKGEVQKVIVWGIMAVVCLIITKRIYDVGKVTVFFETEGLRLINDGQTKHYYVSWGNFTYGYYCGNWHGNLCLVLSKEPLNQKYLKTIVNQSSSSLRPKMCIDNVIVIPINGSKEISRINVMILEKIPSVKDK